jgi:hypothetical protein
MTRSVVVMALAAALAGAAVAQEKAKPPPGGPVPVPYPATTKSALAPDAAALRAKLVKARADLIAEGLTDKPPNLSASDAALYQAHQSQTRKLADSFQDMVRRLDGGASTADVGQQLQFALQEANNTYQQSQQSKSNALKKLSDTTAGIIGNVK